MKWYMVIISLIVGLALGIPGSAGDDHDVSQYFPIQEGMIYDFGGEGNEFAPFTREIKYIQDGYVQIHDTNPGAEAAKVYHITEDSITLVWQEGEYYGEGNIIDTVNQLPSLENVLLQAPISVGNRWEGPDRIREIVGVGETVTVPAGTFAEVVIVRSDFKNENSGVIYEYYAKGMGLILRKFITEGYEISSFLRATL